MCCQIPTKIVNKVINFQYRCKNISKYKNNYLVHCNYGEIVGSLFLVVQLRLEAQLAGAGLDGEGVPHVGVLANGVAHDRVEPTIWISSSEFQEAGSCGLVLFQAGIVKSKIINSEVFMIHNMMSHYPTRLFESYMT